MIFLWLFLMLAIQPLEANDSKVCLREQCLAVEVVSTPEAMRQGLMHRETIDDQSGMLFIFDHQGYHGMWMKNMRMSIDMLWLNQQGQIVTILENLPPCEGQACPVYTPQEEAAYVLELKAHRVQQLGWQEGDMLELRGIK